MPLQKLQFRPGVSREATSLANEGGFYACDKIRFRSGQPEKIGGWASPTISSFLGTCRHLLEWVSLTGYYLLGMGTNLKYYIYSGGTYYDATPIRETQSLGANPFLPIYGTLGAAISSTTQTSITVTSGTAFSYVYPYVIKIDSEEIWVGSASGTTLTDCIRGYNGTTAATHSNGSTITSTHMTVASTANGAVANDFVTFSAATAFGPYTAANLNKEFQITAVASNYVLINAGVYSASATAGGGSAPVKAAYQINTGFDIATFGNGWGTGAWGTSAPDWNEGSSFGVPYALKLWSADNFGQDIVFCDRNNAVYYWSVAGINPPAIPTGLSAGGQIIARGVPLNTAAGADAWWPQVAAMVFVTEERHIVALGANDPTAADPSEQDPMFIRWSEQEDPLTWEPTPTNTAGFQRLAYGSRLITAEKTRQEVLLWSDNALYSMRYLGPPYTFGFNTLSAATSIASPNAVASANEITYWMGSDKFYAYSGRVDTLPCALRQYVFDDINLGQLEQVCAGTLEQFNEVWWFYCSASSSYIDRYVVYNYLEKIWYYGNMNRTAWLDSHITGYPWATTENKLYQHEITADDGTTNPPSPIAAYVESADFDLGEGDQFQFVKRIIPDIDFIGSTTTEPSVTFTIQARDFPGQGAYQRQQTGIELGAKVSTQVYNYTQQNWIRLRGRQVAVKISSDALGVKWQLGTPRLEIQPDGRKN